MKLTAISNSPWFIFGHGYGGKYVPYIVDLILASTKFINLKGIGLEAPFTSPPSILSEIPSYAFMMGLIDYQER